MPDNNAYNGLASVFDGNSDFAVMHFVARMVASEMATAAIVEVMAVQNVGDVEPVGLVDIRPMVGQLDGKGLAVPHGTIHNVPYFRLQGGVNAVIVDPVVGDIGLAVFSSHDTSSVKTTRKAGNPGSRRRFDWADALYIGGFLNGTPENYIRFKSNGDIELKPATKVTIAGDLEVTGDVTAASVTSAGEVTGAGKALSTHTHSGVTTGAGTSGPPT